MLRKFFSIAFVFLILACTVGSANAQADNSSRDESPSKEELPKGIKESLAKQRIERDKKDFEELLERGDEAVSITGELEKSYSQNNRFSDDDTKKLVRLEKVVKKIRSEIGGDDDDADDPTAKPLTTADALNTLKNGAVSLVEELKSTSRYSISVAAVQSSNMLLKLVRGLRLRQN